MYLGRTILTLLSLILSKNGQCLLERLGASAQFDALISKGKYHPAGTLFLRETDRCRIHAEYLPEQDTVVSNGNALLFPNRSINSSSYEWYINGLFASPGTDFLYYPSIGVNEIMLIASNGIGRDSRIFLCYLGRDPARSV